MQIQVVQLVVQVVLEEEEVIMELLDQETHLQLVLLKEIMVDLHQHLVMVEAVVVQVQLDHLLLLRV